MDSSPSSNSSLLIPLTFYRPPERNNSGDIQADVNYPRAQPSIIKSWGPITGTPSETDSQTDARSGIILGAVDGTLYLFSDGPHLSFETEASESQISRASRDSPAPSRPSTPSVASPLLPFNAKQRSQVVSGVTTEQVEAPKNYVDFDDEPDKLKGMLKGRQPREGRERLSITRETVKNPDHDTSSTSSLSSLSKHKRQRKEMPKLSHPSAVSSTSKASSSSPNPSSPVNPPVEDSNELKLWCHVITPRSGPGRAVSSLRLIEDNKLVCVLQEHGDLSVISLQDGSCLASVHEPGVSLQPPHGIEEKEPPHALWLWNHLETYRLEQSTLILVSATINPEYPSPVSMDRDNNGTMEKSRISIFEFQANDHIASLDVSLEIVGQWSFDGASHRVGLYQHPDNSLIFFSMTEEGMFSIKDFRILPHTPPQADSRTTDKDISLTSTIPLSNPFKALKSRSTEHLPSRDNGKEPGRVMLDAERELGEVLTTGPVVGFRTLSTSTMMRGLAWSERELTVFEYETGGLHVLHKQPTDGVRDAHWATDSSYTILFEDKAETYMLGTMGTRQTKAGENVVLENGAAMKPHLLQTFQIGRYEIADIGSASRILTIRLDSGTRFLVTFGITPANRESKVLWQLGPPYLQQPIKTELTSLLPLELDVIIQGYADGCIRQSSLIQMISQNEASKYADKVSKPALNGFVTSLHLVWNSRTKERFIMGGGDDGSVAFWTTDNLKMCARWTLFTAPLHWVIQIDASQHGPLRGCVLCISADGTIATIVVDGFQFLYLVPGSAAPLCRVCIGADNLLLVYADNRARLWDIKTQEFWRSMTLEKVEELVAQGGWTDINLNVHRDAPDVALKPIFGTSSIDVGSTLILDLERFATDSITVTKSISTNRDQTRAILLTLERLRSVLSVLLTPGLNNDIDQICSAKLGIHPSAASIGLVSKAAITIYRSQRPRQPWCLSGDASAARALAITVVLGALSLFEELMEGANTVTIFYATSLASAVGPGYKAPSLVYLARRWFDGSTEVRRSARVLFDYAVACSSDDESNETVEYWQHHLPCLQPTADRESAHAALALFLCGYLASEKYSLVSTSALTDISKSIALYLHDEQSLHRVLAIDLCSRGFHIWQHYVDAMEILRALFTLATTSRKEHINVQNIGSQARLAVLQIASSNTALFMTTLGLDILTPSTLEHRRSVMQIVAFLIRKRPLVLQPNIPRMMEAVVKSLDPNATTHREAVLDSATEIIGYVVKTFPTVDFHMTNQRLAVGSGDGAVVMYDLKTATRLYVLECHKKPISACSFSPDGRRLLTLSLEESLVLVWKVGSSFTSFFNPGAPPRQGHGGSDPFKTISFNVGSEAKMTVQETMDLIRFDWVADRSVKIKIRESIMTFST